MDFLKEWETKLAIKITCSQVNLPPGSALEAFTQQQSALLAPPITVHLDTAISPTYDAERTPAWDVLKCMHALPDRLTVVRVSQEKEPMGTAGPLALAHEILNDGSGAPFFVLNRCAQRPYSSPRT